MNKLLSYALMSTFALSTLFVSCKKDSDSDGGGNVSSSNLTPGKSIVKANISGAYGTSYASTELVSTATKAGGQILITSMTQPSASNLNVDQFVIYLPENIQTGSYKTTDITGAGGIFTFTHSEAMGGNSKGWQADPEGETVFNFTINKITSTEIEGTFNGEMSNDNDNTKITASGSFAGKFN